MVIFLDFLPLYMQNLFSEFCNIFNSIPHTYDFTDYMVGFEKFVMLIISRLYIADALSFPE